MVKNKQKLITYIACIAGICAAASGCKPQVTNDENSTVVATLKSEPATLHPVCDPPNAGRITVFDYTQKTLTRNDMRTLQQIPLLVKGLAGVSADGKAFTYELRNDVKWDDGSPLTVDDVIFTMKVTKCPATNDANVRPVYSNVLDIVKDPANPQKFTMQAKDVYYQNIYTFDELYLIEKKLWDPQDIFGPIGMKDMDAKDFDAKKYKGLEEWEKSFGAGENGHDPKKLSGLGAYAVSDWKPGASITLTRKNNWWGANDTSAYSHAYPSQIIFKIVPDEQARIQGLINRTVDADVWLSTSSYDKLKADTAFTNHYNHGIVDQFLCNTISINTRASEPALSDKLVRRALAYLVPVDELNKNMTKGTGTRQASFIQPVFKKYYNDTLKLIPFDIEKAKALLEQAGWRDTDGDNIRDKMVNGKKEPLRFKFSYIAADPSGKEYYIIIREAMLKAGVDLVADPMDLSVLQKKAGEHDFDMLLAGTSGGAIPDDPEQVLSTKSSGPNGGNLTGFGSAASDKVIEESNKETDVAKRAEKLKKLQAMVYEEQPYIFLYAVKRKVAISKRFDNFQIFSERPGYMLNNLKLKSK